MNNSGRLGRSSATIFGTSLDRAFRFSFHFHANLTGKRVDKADCGNVCDWLPSGGKCFGEKANSKKSGSVLAPTRRWYVNAKLMRQAKKKKRKTFSAQGSEAETKGPRRRKASKPTHASLGVTPSSCASPPPNKASSENVDRSGGRGIGDFAEDGRTACAGGRRQICRALVKRFISEESEGEGFLRVHGHPELGGSEDGHE